MRYDQKKACGHSLLQTFWKLLPCFVVIESIASTTAKFVKNVRVEVVGHFIFKLKKKLKYVLMI